MACQGNILKRCSKELMPLCLAWDYHKLGQYEKNTTALNSSLTQSDSDADVKKASNNTRVHNVALIKKLTEHRGKKFVRDNLSFKSESRTNNIHMKCFVFLFPEEVKGRPEHLTIYYFIVRVIGYFQCLYIYINNIYIYINNCI